jgi:hypothetical protein
LRTSFLAAGTAAFVLGVAGIASAQDAPTTLDISLSPSKAGTNAKPKAAKLVLKIGTTLKTQTASELKIAFPKGIKLSTSDFKKCDLDRLGAEGPAACDKGSQVGPTTKANALAAVNGTSPAPVVFDVTPYATGARSIAFYLQLGSIAGVATATVSGQNLTVKIPEAPAQQLPAGVYNGLVDITANLWVKSGKSVVKITKCPSNKKLTFKNTITFVPNPNAPAVPSHTATADVKCS